MRNRLVVFGCLLLLAFPASSCKLHSSSYTLKHFLDKSESGTVIFSGRVTSVSERIEGELITQTIQMTTSRWWLGEAQEEVVFIGQKGTAAGTSCAGVFEFYLARDQEWVIVGYVTGGKLIPMNLLSKRMALIESQKKSLDELIAIEKK